MSAGTGGVRKSVGGNRIADEVVKQKIDAVGFGNRFQLWAG
jgi:hypothetical protein